MAERLVPFGKYYLLERVNVGGMAEVFKAKTVGVEGFEKLVAIKRILPSVAEDEEFIKMFIDEAKITSQLSHANLAQTFDLGKINDAYYIAMEYVPGKDLRAVQERLKRRGERVPINIATYVIGRVCEGLDYAHRKRDIAGRELHIVHRDVSPQNVIVSFEGEVKLIDFGIAKAANKITSTQAGILKGKFGYMSPEQVRGLPLDQRSDIFAAGVVLYELCTGERLFTGSSDYSVLEKVQQAKITPPSEVVRDIPDRLEAVILKALAREPEQRYQHAADLAQDLMRFLIESHTRIVSRDDVAAFMKAVFPDDDARERRAEAAVLDRTRTGARRVDIPPDSVRTDQPEQRQHHHEPRLREPPARETEAQRLQREHQAREQQAQEQQARETRDRELRDRERRDQEQREQQQRDQQQREIAARVKEAARKAPLNAPPSAPPKPQRSQPPKLPASLIAGINLAAEDGNELTPRGPTRPPAPAEFLSTDPGTPTGTPPPLKPPPLAQQSARPPPIPAAPAPAAAEKSESSVPMPSKPAPWLARDDDERTEPGLFAPPSEDEPTRPMSMKDLAEAERIYIERERASVGAGRAEITDPGGPPSMTAHVAGSAPPAAPKTDPAPPPSAIEPPQRRSETAPSAASPLEAALAATTTTAPIPASPIAAAPLPATPSASAKGPSDRGVPIPAPRGETSRAARPARPPAPLPSTLLADSKPSAVPEITDPGGPPSMIPAASLPFADERDDDNTPSGRLRRGQPLQAAAPRAALSQPPRSEERRAPYGGRMQVPKPTLVGTDPGAPDEPTVSKLTQRAQLIRFAKIGVTAAALGIVAWVWLSIPHKKDELAGPPSASLTITTQPEDAVVLLDGAQVKGSLDRDFTEPKLPAGQEHVLIIRREGFIEQTQPLTLNVNEQKVLTVQLQPLPGQLTVRSSPSGAQVFLDGQSVGTTPAYLPNVVQEASHAISLEKRCYRPWQVAIPAHAGKREVAATLEPIFGACPNMKVEKEEKTPELPVDDPKAMASLGFLSLGSRPSASIFIDGVDIGRTTPLVQWPLKVGRHKIRLVLGRNKRDVTVEVRSGQTASEIVDLRKH